MKVDERAELRGRGLERISVIALEPVNGVQLRVEHIKITVTLKTFRNFISLNRPNVKTRKL